YADCPNDATLSPARMFDRRFMFNPPPTKRPGLTDRYAISYRRANVYFTFVALSVPASDPSSYVFSEVQFSRLSPWRNQRSSPVKIEKRTLESTCCFCETRIPPAAEEMCVDAGSPRKKAMLPLTPSVSPVVGLAPMAGASTMNRRAGSACAPSGRIGSDFGRHLCQRSVTSAEGHT